jgi:hypothetical protein
MTSGDRWKESVMKRLKIKGDKGSSTKVKRRRIARGDDHRRISSPDMIWICTATLT